LRCSDIVVKVIMTTHDDKEVARAKSPSSPIKASSSEKIEIEHEPESEHDGESEYEVEMILDHKKRKNV
jgi:hypothetical protein